MDNLWSYDPGFQWIANQGWVTWIFGAACGFQRFGIWPSFRRSGGGWWFYGRVWKRKVPAILTVIFGRVYWCLLGIPAYHITTIGIIGDVWWCEIWGNSARDDWRPANGWWGWSRVHQAVSALHHHRAHQYLDFVFKGQGIVKHVKWPKETAQLYAQVVSLLFVKSGRQKYWFEMIKQKFTMHIHGRI